MTGLRPRRIEELLSLSDSDDESDDNRATRSVEPNPERWHADVAIATSSAVENKENKTPDHTCNEDNDNEYQTPLLIPRRPSGLSELDIDDDVDESGHNRNLLNESFMQSPENVEGKPAGTLTDTSAALEATLVRLSIGAQEKPARELNFLHTIQEEATKSHTRTITASNTQRLPVQTPMNKQLSERKPFSATMKRQGTHAQSEFATPLMQRQTCENDSMSTQSRLTREDFTKQCRTQKVLFQTPAPVRRAPLPSPSNDSLIISLCNTPEPKSAGGIATLKQEPAATAPTTLKRSLDDDFRNADKPQKPALIAIATASGSIEPAVVDEKTNTMEINGVSYELSRKLGSGGSSSVYLAQRCDNQNTYALKIVDLHGDPAVVQGYLNEAKLLQKLQGHVCVVRLYEFQLLPSKSELYMIMEKGDCDLNSILQQYKTHMPLYTLMNLLYQMLQAVNYIHKNGVIHSDLKPANFLMCSGRLKLIDFGIASNISVDATSIIKFNQVGTFNYISPEALIDTSTGSSPVRNNRPKMKISTKSDVWSLGCILYLFLYQKTPFNHIKNIYQKVNAITSPETKIQYPDLPSYYPALLLQMTKSCLQHNPKNRPSCADLLNCPFDMIIPLKHLTISKTS